VQHNDNKRGSWLSQSDVKVTKVTDCFNNQGTSIRGFVNCNNTAAAAGCTETLIPRSITPTATTETGQ